MLDFKDTPIEALEKQIKAILEEHDLLKELEYFAGPLTHGMDAMDRTQPPPRHRWAVCFVVRGGSEDYYVHLDLLVPIDRPGGGYEHRPMFLARTLLYEVAEQVANLVTRAVYR